MSILSYIVSLWPAWATRDLILKKNQRKKGELTQLQLCNYEPPTALPLMLVLPSGPQGPERHSLEALNEFLGLQQKQKLTITAVEKNEICRHGIRSQNF